MSLMHVLIVAVMVSMASRSDILGKKILIPFKNVKYKYLMKFLVGIGGLWPRYRNNGTFIDLNT